MPMFFINFPHNLRLWSVDISSYESRSFTASATVSTRRAAARVTRVGGGAAGGVGRASTNPQATQRRSSAPASITILSSA